MLRRYAFLVVCSVIALCASLTILSAQPPREPMPAVENYHPAHRVLYHVMRRGAEWLMQAQQPNGLFHPGLQVAFNTPLESAHFYYQTEAAIALAKVSRLTSNPRYHAAAQQAVLTLLANTKVDTQDAQLRYTVLPESSVNRLGSAGLLLRAVHELPVPVDVRLKEAEGLAGYVRSNQQADGLLSSIPSGIQQVGADASQAVRSRYYEGLAVEGLALSLTYSPAPWKTEALQKAARGYVKQYGQMPVSTYPDFITGLAETYLRTKDPVCAEAVFNMADALCNVQKQAEAGKVAMTGGFVTGSAKMSEAVPQAGESARCTTALCDAYRVAKLAGDTARADKYRQAAGMGIQFVVSLQMTGNSVEHFSESYQPRVLGAFLAQPGEGVIRLQDTAECVLAVSTYLSDVCGVSLSPGQAVPGAPAVPK